MRFAVQADEVNMTQYTESVEASQHARTKNKTKREAGRSREHTHTEAEPYRGKHPGRVFPGKGQSYVKCD